MRLRAPLNFEKSPQNHQKFWKKCQKCGLEPPQISAHFAKIDPFLEKSRFFLEILGFGEKNRIVTFGFFSVLKKSDIFKKPLNGVKNKPFCFEKRGSFLTGKPRQNACFFEFFDPDFGKKWQKCGCRAPLILKISSFLAKSQR